MSEERPEHQGDEQDASTARTLVGKVYRQLDLAFSRFGDHKLTDWAAAMTYYSMLSIFPGLLVLVSILGLVGASATDAIIENLDGLAPNAVRDVILGAVRGLQQSGTAATVLLIAGLITALYSASSYIGAYIRAAGIVLGIPEQRRFYQTIPLRVGLTALLMVLILLTGLAIVLTGPIADEVARWLGVTRDTSGVWSLIKWPVVILLAVLALAILFNLGPDHTGKRKFRLITPGIALSVALWILLSILFSLYVGSFSRYNQVYGSLAGVVIFLIWMWLSNVAVLLGLEFDSELTRFREKHGYGAFSRQRF